MKYLIKNKKWDIAEDYNINKILYLLIDRPNHISSHNAFIWIMNKDEWLRDWHREYDLPAFVRNDGCVKWCKNDFCYKVNY